MGGIFAGLFSPTEGGAVGAFGALIIGLVKRRIDLRVFILSVRETVQLSAMIFFIVVGVSVFDFFMQASRVQDALTAFIDGLDASPATVVAVLIIVLILLGCVMDAIAIVFVTTPFIYPIIIGLGYDPIWFGIITVMVVEIGLVTPPFGMNIFVIARLVPEVTTWGAFQGVLPFIAADILRIALFLAAPGLVLLLPDLLYGVAG
jgi:C4-dicarboxylate transporter, DctM subunit